ncbi:MAG: glucose-6-phosphate dehydrogenase [Rhodobacterales bacterium]|nr:MAG: glucose-6-phosphate dehydrogenase [Rhodobacterales bacterium]
MATRVIPVEIFDLVIFGGTGDLARRKVIPALYQRFVAGQIPEGARIIAAARSDLDDTSFRKLAKQAITEHTEDSTQNASKLKAFLAMLSYLKIDALGSTGWAALAKTIRRDVVQAFYFSVGPSLFGPLAERLSKYEISGPQARIVVEKPFGHDLQTAQELNRVLAQSFDEHQIYRIDHYLGKETVQNLMAVRFANILFEPLWNAQYVDHIQITVAETVGIDGRGAYYDKSGAMRDMVQNHLMQLLCLIAMEPPAQFTPDAVRDEKLKVIRALDQVAPEDIVRGQYRAGDGSNSYLEDCENPDSTTESFLAIKLHLSNWRWNGTPFYLRTGKRLRARKSEIAVAFKSPPHMIFKDQPDHLSNELLIHLQPDEGMDLRVTIKEPGPGGMRLMDVPLDMSFADALGEAADAITDAYERLVMDVIRGDQTLFMRGDEVEAAWAWVDPLIAAWQARADVPQPYDAGSAGPADSLMLMHKDGRRWREIS